MKIESQTIKMVDIDSIVPNPENPNKHSEEQIERLEKIIKFNGFRNPLHVSKRSGFLIAGHGRLEAAKNLGIKELPVIEQDFENEAKEYAHLIADNEIARWSEIDRDVVLGINDKIDFQDIEVLGLEFDFVSCADIDLDAELSNAGIEMNEETIRDGVKKAIQIEFNLEHYEEAQELVKYWRDKGAYIGEMIISFLREERVKHEENGADEV